MHFPKIECTFLLSEQEVKILAEMAEYKGMSESNLIRQALRVYQAVELSVNHGTVLTLLRPPMGNLMSDEP